MLTRWALFILIFFPGLFLSLAIEHTRRKSRVGFWVGVSFIALSATVGLFCPFTLPARFVINFVTGVNGFSLSGRALEVKYAEDWRQHLVWTQNRQTHEWILTGVFTPAVADVSSVGSTAGTNAASHNIIPFTTGGPAWNSTDSTFPIIQGVTATFQPKPGMPDKLSNGLPALFPAETQFSPTKIIATDLPGIRFTNAPESLAGNSLSLFVLDAASAHRVLGKTGTLKLSLYGRTQTLIPEAAIPLKGSTVARPPGELIHVTRLDRAPLFVSCHPERRQSGARRLESWV
jgi:hypothetical protein